MSFSFFAITLLAYLVGSITPAYIAARITRGIDLRKFGTRNTGISNLWHAIGKRVAILIPVILFDLAKSWPLLWAAKVMGLGFAGQAAVIVAVVVGHNWPVYLRFHGGRGMLSTLGIALIIPVINHLPPWPLATGLTILVLGTFVLRNAPLGVGLGVVSLFVVSLAIREPFAMTMGYLGITLAMIIRRLALPRRDISVSLSLPRLLINRLLFDRDIRDRKAWMNYVSSPANSNQRDKD
ncbi:MAG: glycerol-3-phosphate acyltransferase [Dehalococcoidales bacterium]|jgi:glycerol-3-phosphate acyltransferase PlsY